jgi:hypothetical protein
MAAHEHLNSKLFHSSPHLFKKGELVKPINVGAMTNYGGDTTPHAFATNDLEKAKEYAIDRAENGTGTGAWINEVETPQDITSVSEQVKRVMPKDVHPAVETVYGKEYASKTGFVATGRATFHSRQSERNVSTPWV